MFVTAAMNQLVTSRQQLMSQLQDCDQEAIAARTQQGDGFGAGYGRGGVQLIRQHIVH